MYKKGSATEAPLLAIDVGNTSLAMGLFESPATSDLIKTAKISSHPQPSPESLSRRILQFLGKRIVRNKVNVVIGSVVPSLVKPILRSIHPCSLRALEITSGNDFGFRLSVETPSALGVDRIANTVAAWALRKRPVAVADFGSATTISIMDGTAFRGGAILPGVTMMRDALSRETARLPHALLGPTICAVGTNTSAAIRSGIILGTTGAVEKIISSSEKELGCRLSLVVTGGNASLTLPYLHRTSLFVPDLTFQGLRLIFLRQLDISL